MTEICPLSKISRPKTLSLISGVSKTLDRTPKTCYINYIKRGESSNSLRYFCPFTFFIMQLIDIETHLVKISDTTYSHVFKNYAKVSLSFQDAKDIDLIRTKLPNSFLESIDWKQGTAFFEPFNLYSWDNRFRKEETIDAYYRFCTEIDKINELFRESSNLRDKKGENLHRYLFNENCIKDEINELVKSLRARNQLIRDCVETLDPEECKLIGIKDIFEEFNVKEFMNLVNKEKDSYRIDTALIESLESTYHKDIN